MHMQMHMYMGVPLSRALCSGTHQLLRPISVTLLYVRYTIFPRVPGVPADPEPSRAIPSHPEPSRAIPSHPESTNPQAAAVLSVTLSSGAAHQSARRGEGGLTRRTATRVAVGQVCVCVCVLRGGEVGARVWGCATSKYVSQWSVPYLPLSGFTPPVCQVCQADS
jgi:hypothetical protein